MKQVLKILKFEYLNCVKNKAFIITTVVLMAAILLSTFIPALIMSLISEDEEEPGEGEPTVAAISSSVYDEELIKSEFESLYPENEIKVTTEDIETLKKKVNDDDYVFAVLIDSELNFTYITQNNGFYDDSYQDIRDAVKSMYTVTALEQKGVSRNETSGIMNASVTFSLVATGTDQSKNYLPVYVLMCALFVAITSYGQLVAQSVVSEKNTRAMELLITCAKPTHLMFGKVIGSGLAGLTQLALILLTAAGSLGTTASSFIPDNILEYIQIPFSTVALALVFFVLGYFMYAFLLGALASFASKSEDLNTLISPVILILSGTYMVLIFITMSDAINSTFMTVLSYFPLTSPMAMFVKATLTDTAVWEIALSIVIQIVTLYLLGMLAAAIYKIGVLMYGNPPKFSEIIKMLRMQRKSEKAK